VPVHVIYVDYTDETDADGDDKTEMEQGSWWAVRQTQGPWASM